MNESKKTTPVGTLWFPTTSFSEHPAVVIDAHLCRQAPAVNSFIVIFRVGSASSFRENHFRSYLRNRNAENKDLAPIAMPFTIDTWCLE